MCFLLHFSTEHFQHKKREINKKFFKKFFLAKAICFFRKKDRSVWREKPCFPRPKPVSRPLILLTILRSSRLQADCPHLIHPSYNQTKIYSISLPTKQKDAARVIREDIFLPTTLKQSPHQFSHTSATRIQFQCATTNCSICKASAAVLRKRLFAGIRKGEMLSSLYPPSGRSGKGHFGRCVSSDDTRTDAHTVFPRASASLVSSMCTCRLIVSTAGHRQLYHGMRFP